MLLSFKLISAILPVNRRWHQVQLGMRSNSGARDFSMKQRSTSAPPLTTSTAIAEDSGQDTPLVAAVDAHVISQEQNSNSANEANSAEPAESRSWKTVTVAVQTVLSETRRHAEHAGASSMQAYPTDSHVEAKGRREAREVGKTPEEVKVMRKKKPQTQQVIFDDWVRHGVAGGPAGYQRLGLQRTMRSLLLL